jgi:hypothetical protein
MQDANVADVVRRFYQAFFAKDRRAGRGYSNA